MIQGHATSNIQLSRTMWASVETLFAAIVAIVPSIYTLIRRGRSENESSYYLSGASALHSGTRQPSTLYASRRSYVKTGAGPHSQIDAVEQGTGHGIARATTVRGVRSKAWSTELDDLAGKKDRETAEDASTKGILVATTIDLVHEVNSRNDCVAGDYQKQGQGSSDGLSDSDTEGKQRGREA